MKNCLVEMRHKKDDKKLPKFKVLFSNCCFVSANSHSHGLRVVWEVTHQCRWKCPYCFNASNIVENELAQKQRLHVIQKLFDLGVTHILFTGGEVLTIGNHLVNLIEKTKSHGIDFSISTTGYPLSLLVKVVKQKPSCINIGLDGSNKKINDEIRGKGHFEHTMKVLSYLRDKEIRTKVNCVLLQRNVSRLDLSFFEHLTEKFPNISQLNFHIPSRIGRGTNVLGVSVSDLSNFSTAVSRAHFRTTVRISLIGFRKTNSIKETCAAVNNFMGIFPDGRYGVCPLLQNYSSAFSIGNILLDTESAIISKLKRAKNLFPDVIRKISFLPPSVNICRFKDDIRMESPLFFEIERFYEKSITSKS